MDSLLNQETDIVEWLNILIRNPETAEQDLSALSIKLQLIEQDLELSLDYLSYGVHSTMQSLKCEVEGIHRQTLDLVQESQTISKTLSSIYTPEITELRQNHSALGLVQSSKQALQEIENIDSKLVKAAEASRHHSEESVVIVKDLYSILKKIQDVPGYLNYYERILQVIENFDNTLTELCFLACKDLNLAQLKKVKNGFESFENLSKFNEIIYACRLEALPNELFDNSLEGFEELGRLITTEVLLFREVSSEHEGILLGFIHSFLLKIKFLAGFDQLEVEKAGPVFEAFLVFSRQIKDHLGSLDCLSDFLDVFTLRVKTEETSLKNLQKLFFRPVSLQSWTSETKQIIRALEDSWNRSLVISFGTCGFDWARMAEDVLSEQFKLLNSNYSNITNVPTDVENEKSRFKWTHCNKFIQVFEGILEIYTLIEDLSVKCRNSYLQNMTTSYFNPQMETNKEFQTVLMKKFPSLLKNNQGFISFLREGGVFFAKSLENVEKELEICKGFIEKLLMTGINSEINSYSELDLFKAPESIFSVSPSQVITRCGEHVLEMLENLEVKDGENYFKAFGIIYATKPSQGLPHSNALHFWVMGFVSRFLKLFMLKVSKISGITSQGRKQLQADVEYLFTITNTLGLLRQDDGSFARNLILLRQKLTSGQLI